MEEETLHHAHCSPQSCSLYTCYPQHPSPHTHTHTHTHTHHTHAHTHRYHTHTRLGGCQLGMLCIMCVDLHKGNIVEHKQSIGMWNINSPTPSSPPTSPTSPTVPS